VRSPENRNVPFSRSSQARGCHYRLYPALARLRLSPGPAWLILARPSSFDGPETALPASTLPAADVSTFQGLILALQRYWASQGCVLLQPLDLEVGAGTFHPATFLRAIGPEPWSAAYVQPSRRPTDGRYGENPNRLQHYYQFQVVIKPSPPEIQDLYLESLRMLGIDPSSTTSGS